MTANAFAAGATLVSLAFACSTFERWLVRRRRHELAWSVALAMFAIGSAALWAGAALGWDAWSFRLFYLFGGVLNVPFLALGTVYLLAGQQIGDRVGAVLCLVGAFAAGVLTIAPLRHAVAPHRFPEGHDLFGVLPRVFAGVGSGIAATVIIGGAVWSAIRLVRHRGPSRMAAANVLIAAGTLLISAKALFEGLGDDETAFAAALASGISVVFVGFLLTNAPVHRAEPDAPAALTAGGLQEAEPEPAGAGSAQGAP
ncbi:MAG: hypothetical protein JO291_06450 [Acidimicrobiia bacterium]|nr:hypothetical protein [Acidimicrobiia bacterium]